MAWKTDGMVIPLVEKINAVLSEYKFEPREFEIFMGYSGGNVCLSIGSIFLGPK